MIHPFTSYHHHCCVTLLYMLCIVAYNTYLYCTAVAGFHLGFSPNVDIISLILHGFFPWSVQGQYRPKSVVKSHSRFWLPALFSCRVLVNFCELFCVLHIILNCVLCCRCTFHCTVFYLQYSLTAHWKMFSARYFTLPLAVSVHYINISAHCPCDVITFHLQALLSLRLHYQHSHLQLLTNRELI